MTKTIHTHDWQKTERNIPGAILYAHVCPTKSCQKVACYEMKVINTKDFKGLIENIK